MAEKSRGWSGAKRPAAPSCPYGQLYMVRPGDSMFTIARQFGIPLSTLIAANPQIADPNMIYPGQPICVPGAVAPPTPTCPGGFMYTVQPGDSLFAIARRFGVTLDAIKAANPQIVNPDLIYPGQAVCVPIPAPPMTCPHGTLYTVQPCDTMLDIATRFGITLQALLSANPQVTDPNRIYAGQVLCIPTEPAAVLPAPIPFPPLPVMPPMPCIPAVPAIPAVPMPVAPGMPMMPPCPPIVPPCPMPAPYYAMPPCPMPMPCPVMPLYPMPMPCPAMQPIEIQPVGRRRGHREHRPRHHG